MPQACSVSLLVAALACGTAPRAPTLGRDAPSLVIRHVTGHQVVALVEIGSPSNKDC